MNAFVDTFRTTFGPFSVAVNESGALLATAFGGPDTLSRRLRQCHWIDDTSRARPAREQILSYCAGELRTFDLPLAPSGTPFQQRVWSALATIPFGETRTYAQLAAMIGNANASRAVGRANATNPICLIVPCHRVIGSDGSLTGFAFGETIKRQLLEHERRLSTRDFRAA